MPTYEYVCGTCGHKFEGRVAIADRDRMQRCPACGEEQGRRRLTACAVQGIQRGGNAGCAGCGGKNCSTCH